MQLSTTGNNTKPWKSPKSITKENICKKIIMNSFKLITLIKAILTYFKKWLKRVSLRLAHHKNSNKCGHPTEQNRGSYRTDSS